MPQFFRNRKKLYFLTRVKTLHLFLIYNTSTCEFNSLLLDMLKYFYSCLRYFTKLILLLVFTTGGNAHEHFVVMYIYFYKSQQHCFEIISHMGLSTWLIVSSSLLLYSYVIHFFNCAYKTEKMVICAAYFS